MLVVATGEVSVRRNDALVTRLGPGDVVGEMATIDGEPRSATVVAETDVSVIVLEKRDFERLIETVPGLARDDGGPGSASSRGRRALRRLSRPALALRWCQPSRRACAICLNLSASSGYSSVTDR